MRNRGSRERHTYGSTLLFRNDVIIGTSRKRLPDRYDALPVDTVRFRGYDHSPRPRRAFRPQNVGATLSSSRAGVFVSIRGNVAVPVIHFVYILLFSDFRRRRSRVRRTRYMRRRSFPIILFVRDRHRKRYAADTTLFPTKAHRTRRFRPFPNFPATFSHSCCAPIVSTVIHSVRRLFVGGVLLLLLLLLLYVSAEKVVLSTRPTVMSCVFRRPAWRHFSRISIRTDTVRVTDSRLGRQNDGFVFVLVGRDTTRYSVCTFMYRLCRVCWPRLVSYDDSLRLRYWLRTVFHNELGFYRARLYTSGLKAFVG